MIVNEKELKKKREWFEDRGDDKTVFLYNEGKLAAIVYNIMDIEDVY